MSKGDKVSKTNRGSGVLVVLRGLWRRGSVLEGRVQVRGGVRRPHALPSEVRGAAASSAASSSFGPRRFQGLNGPASWPVSRLTGAALDPSTLPSWTHEDTSMHARGRDRSPEERRTRHITEAVMRLHSLQVPPDLAVSAPLLSHTPTPVGSLVKGGD